MSRWTYAVVVGGLVALSVGTAIASDDDAQKPPDFYIGPAINFDLENDDTEITVGFAGSGSSTIAPDLGLYDDKLLLGVQYMALGTRADLDSAIYGGPTLFWYDDHFGGGLIVGRHLSRRVIIEATYRATDEWQGEADLSLGYGFHWPW